VPVPLGDLRHGVPVLDGAVRRAGAHAVAAQVEFETKIHAKLMTDYQILVSSAEFQALST
jgi:hypothetical protein